MSSHVPHGRGNRGGRGGRGGGTPIIDRTGVPRGVCSFYWSTGACNRSFDCTYKHEVKPQASSVCATETEDVSPDFFSREGLAINNGSVMDSQHTLRPNEAHNHLKPYLADDFVFRGANNVEGFSRIFASVNSRNKAWGNTLLRIGDVLRFSPVAVNVGAGTSTLSYQKGYFPIIEFLSSDLVLKTTMHQNTNMIYALLDRNYDDFHFTTRKCMREMIEARTWMDRSPGLPVSRQNTLSGVVVFGALSIVLSQYFARVKSAMKNHPELHDLVEDIISWFNIWTAAVRASPPTFKDPITSSSLQIRNPTLGELGKDISRLSQIVGREYGDTEKLRRRVPNGRLTAGQRMEALTSRLEQAYDPPGTLRDGGEPRHDNDFADIRDIRIAPTNEELLCPFPPYLPVALPSAPHHLPEHSMERHLDIQFRLLREELVSSIRQSVGKIRSDLEIIWAPGTGLKTRRSPTLLEKLLSSKGGAYATSGANSVFFQLYTGACFAPLRAERRNFTVGLTLDSPPGAPRGQNGTKRAEYWENSKRLQQGSLVALALISPGRFQVFLGTTVSGGADIAEFAKTNEETIQLRVSFFDAEIELMALRRQPISVDKSTFAVLIDNQIMFEALHPFLRTLKDVEPTSVPFSALISYTGNLASMPVVPPRYTRVPWFKYNLQCLARPGERISSVDVNNLTSVAIARQQLTRSSKLDPSQVDAVIGTLTREVSLIQGPPGTGKSFTGKEILRVLFASQIRPIVLIAFTNHALDHMLTSVLDDKFTENVVRLGSRATDERIEQYSLYKLEQLSGRRELDRSMGREYAAMKRVEEEMTRIMNRIQLPGLTWKDTERFLDFHYPQHADSFRGPPFWIAELLRRAVEDEIANGEWTRVSKGKKSPQDADVSEVYGFWKYARDIEFIRPLPSSSNRATSEKRTDPDPRIAFFNELGFKGPIPLVPIGSRSVQQLTGVSNVWSMSICERQRLAESWEDEMRKIAYDSLLSDFDDLRTRYKDACKIYEDMRDEARRRLLSRTDLIACTTTGNVGPKVLMVEEAGQVLEAHILASLVPSVEHLICIGDPKQLRPNLATFALSMDSVSGGELFKFDRSLMERLSDGGMSMSQINVQRRMRPSISHFVRTILYPNLEDNEVVRGYPAVHGMEKNVVFFSHNNPENSEDDSVSKHNMFEVAMIRDLVIYLLKQGLYDGDGGIAVLCAYLGQLQKVRAALKDLKIAVSVDERDEEQLERTGLAGDDDMGLVQVQVAHRVGTTVDFSLFVVLIAFKDPHRNSRHLPRPGGQDRDNLLMVFGPLQSSNRINVALSRAKHGLYILGNASNLRKSETWRTVLDEMEKEDQLDYGFPIVCPRHPQSRQLISKPGQLPTHSPKGGCLQPCEYRLWCGHVCPSICHTDQDYHTRTKCNRPCVRVTCPRAHPCPKLCSDDCGNCMSPMYDVRLPCGHIVKSVPCHKLENLETIKCFVPVSKRLPGCEHCVTIACSGDPSNLVCKEICGGYNACCGRTCKSRCHECQEVTRDNAAPRARAIPRCNLKCLESCRQRCGHQKCQKECWEPCSPCMEPCEWRCPHHLCPVVCSSICSRLPCDKACEWRLECGHRCPSVCGEPCKKQTCVICLPDERKSDIVDFIMQRRLNEIDLSSSNISERLIRLECGHIFTVGTLDGHCNMSRYYEPDAIGAFTTIKAPPADFQTPPSCPTCRRPITALRYGRITKKANIDMLEQNVASTMSSTLEEVGSEIESFLGRLDNVKSKAKLIAFYPPSRATDFDILSAHRRTRFGPESEPLSREEISQASMTNVHGFSVEEGRAWHNVVHDLLKLYRKIVRVARTRGPYEQAYGAALATLYRLELSAIARDPERASDTPERVAMREVIKMIGQPPHKAAFFLSFELRYTRIEGLRVFSGHEVVCLHERLWRSFVSFIYESCIHDVEKALKIAKKSSASRLAAQAGANILRGKLELFRFEILAQHTLQLQCGLLNDDRRNELSTKTQLEANTASLEMKKLETRYLRSHRVTDTTQLNSDRTWFTQNCREKGDKIVEEYRALATCLTQRECKPLKAKEDTGKAPSFSQHRRRFFGCVNGHAFAIGTCGAAIEVAHCPGCNAISELPAWLGSIAPASLGASVQLLGGWLWKS
ncbi:hypothetical protein EDB92DRAFT_1938185 [Lactarius akahatsu]|uniref:C3H1-type domain-containing protein n=1 Tax=Lactarius akahatsu TaxID=416441 RepID=A0AAD4L298_9AGAM|nr:hypothetical protein EDB92DRAFT_1938185 [Lactarius akahatsu]